MSVYAVFLLTFFVGPALALGWLVRRELRRYRRTVLWAFVFTGTIGLLWDWLSVRTGVWRYDARPTLGVWVGGLPIEEFVGFYLFGTLLIIEVALLALRLTDGGRARDV